MIVWGDSHADQWVPAVTRWAAGTKDWKVEQLTRIVCPPVLGLSPMSKGVVDPPCPKFNDAVIRRIEATKEPVIVVLAARWAPRIGIQIFEDEVASQMFIDVHAQTAAEAQKAFQVGLRNTLERLNRLKIPTVLVLQSPVPERVPATCVYRIGADKCGLARNRLLRQTAVVDAIIRDVASTGANSAILDPVTFLCTERECPAVIDGRVAYYDQVHVAASTAQSPGSLAIWASKLDAARLKAGH